jgi:BolA protein
MRMAERIHRVLIEGLAPAEVVVTDDSHRHAGHAGNPDGVGETHFTVDVVSPVFAGLSRVARHRRVTSLLAAEFDKGLHALQLNLRAPGE